jgi:hypothetical protein
LKLKTIDFFGNNPRILNGIERVVKAKQHGLYQTPSGLLSDKIPDAQAIQTMLGEARALKPLNEQVEKFQDEITSYVIWNETFLRDLVMAEMTKPDAKIELILPGEQTMERIKILFVSANPKGTTQLSLDEEAREIEKNCGRLNTATFNSLQFGRLVPTTYFNHLTGISHTSYTSAATAAPRNRSSCSTIEATLSR